MDVFERLAPYIQDYIYSEGWDELREVQVAAADIIFNTEKNLILSSGTASGKTEAAFLPTLTRLYENPSKSIGILYISPLKALINDQFSRLSCLLEDGNVNVCKWHGDASVSKKHQLIKNPAGILQITPESLQSLIMNRRDECQRFFSDLKYVIIDEVHYFMGNPRGIQLLCLLIEIGRICKIDPIRIGLSATLGDDSVAKAWLSTGTKRECAVPNVGGEKRKIRIAAELFYDNSKDGVGYEHIKYLYKNTLNKKCIIFANSRANVESVISDLKKTAAYNHTPDFYRVHHGSISRTLREETEQEMKESDLPIVTGATLTLELGIDIGSLDRIVQIGAPYSVSSFVQRLGRCGRRGQAAELIFTFPKDESREDKIFPNMDWDFLRTIAIIQLYLEEKWIEPNTFNLHPYGLCYHQTMVCLYSHGELTPMALAQYILTMEPFSHITRQDYQLLLRHLITIDHIAKTEDGKLIIGEKGERIVNYFGFYAVFDAKDEYSVKFKSQLIGTVEEMIPVGACFALAGRNWMCIDISENSRVLSVVPSNTVSRDSWVGSGRSSYHTKIVKKMRDILDSDMEYGYLSQKCADKLYSMRYIAKASGMLKNILIEIDDNCCCIFPWVGLGEFSEIFYGLKGSGLNVENKGYYLVVESVVSYRAIKSRVLNFMSDEFDAYSINYPKNIELEGKYNNYIPKSLLKKQYIEDYIKVR